MDGWSSLTVALVALVSAYLATRLAEVALARWQVLDLPNERSSHVRPTLRGGGLGVLVGLIVTLAWASYGGWSAPERFVQLAGATLVVALVSFADDLSKSGLAWWLRLIIHAGAAFWVVGLDGGLDRLPLPAPLDLSLGALAVPAAIFWVVCALNFFNFMDGLDGLAGMQLAAVGLAVAVTGAAGGATLGLALAGACFGFLVRNWHPARIFLGDVGSGALGFFVAALPFAGLVEPRSGVLLVGIAMFLFMADASYTLIWRAVNKEPVLKAHKQHQYQHWVQSGASHAEVATAVGVGAILLALLAGRAFRSGDEGQWWLAFAAGTLLFLLEMAYVAWAKRRHRGASLAGS